MTSAATFTLREAQSEDAAAIARIFARSRAEAMPWLPVVHTAKEDVTHFGGLIQAPDKSTWVMDTATGPVAFVVHDREWIHHLYVLPGWQGQGLGRALLARARTQRPRMLLWAFQANRDARRFYEAAGFRAVLETDGAGNEEKLPDVLYEWQA